MSTLTVTKPESFDALISFVNQLSNGAEFTVVASSPYGKLTVVDSSETFAQAIQKQSTMFTITFHDPLIPKNDQPSPLVEFAGSYRTWVRWGGRQGAWHDHSELKISETGDVQLGDLDIKKFTVVAQAGVAVVSWKSDSNAHSGEIKFIKTFENDDHESFWPCKIDRFTFSGWKQHVNEGKIDFRGVISSNDNATALSICQMELDQRRVGCKRAPHRRVVATSAVTATVKPQPQPEVKLPQPAVMNEVYRGSVYPALLSDFAGKFKTEVHWGGPSNKEWHQHDALTVSLAGVVTLGDTKLAPLRLTRSGVAAQFSWKIEDSHTGSIAFYPSSKNVTGGIHWDSSVDELTFAGWIQRPNEGKIEFRGTLVDAADTTSAYAKTRHSATCDHCRGSIVGARYKCTVCPDYDLCEKCETRNACVSGEVHDIEHLMIKIFKPVAFPTRLAQIAKQYYEEEPEEKKEVLPCQRFYFSAKRCKPLLPNLYKPFQPKPKPKPEPTPTPTPVAPQVAETKPVATPTPVAQPTAEPTQDKPAATDNTSVAKCDATTTDVDRIGAIEAQLKSLEEVIRSLRK